MSWILANLGSIIITIVLVLIVVGIVVSLIKDRKKGCSSCAGGCAHCNMCASRNNAETVKGK